jgi:hypothetical protein
MEMHSCPALEKQARTDPSTVHGMSASAQTMEGFLPPSSAEQPISRAAARWAMSDPVAEEPVKAT